MTRVWWLIVVGMAALALLIATPAARVTATAPPSTDVPPITNDLVPENNEVTNCIGTVEQANCGSRARADGHTYLVFIALAAGMGFIGWRIARGVRARDAAHQPMP